MQQRLFYDLETADSCFLFILPWNLFSTQVTLLADTNIVSISNLYLHSLS